MVEPPKPGDQIVVLYREGESKYGMDAVCTQVIPCPLTESPASGGPGVWWRSGDGVFCFRRLDEEGVEWARWSGSLRDFEMLGGWCDLVPTLQAARRLAGTGE